MLLCDTQVQAIHAIYFCLGTRVTKHSAEGIGWSVRPYMCPYVVHITRNVHARVIEAENSITLTIYIPVQMYL